MSDPLQFASLTLDEEGDVSNRGVVTEASFPEETASFVAPQNDGGDGNDDDAIGEPLASAAASAAARAPAATAATAAAPSSSSQSFPDEPPPPYESIVMGTASLMVSLCENKRARAKESNANA